MRTDRGMDETRRGDNGVLDPHIELEGGRRAHRASAFDVSAVRSSPSPFLILLLLLLPRRQGRHTWQQQHGTRPSCPPRLALLPSAYSLASSML